MPADRKSFVPPKNCYLLRPIALFTLEEELHSITSLTIDLIIFDTKLWLTSTEISGFPLHNLELLEKLLKTEKSIRKK